MRKSAYKTEEIKEVFQDLANTVRKLSLEKGMKTFMVTCSLPGEGVSWTAYHLSRALHLFEGTRILLVDANFRNPGFDGLAPQESGPGLAQLLTDSEILPDLSGDYTVLPAGKVMPNSSLLLGSERMKHFLDLWRNDFDFILLDSAPVIPFSDPIVLGRLTDVTLLVVEAGRTRIEVARKAAEKLQEGGTDILRIVLNKYRKVIPQIIYRFL